MKCVYLIDMFIFRNKICPIKLVLPRVYLVFLVKFSAVNYGINVYTLQASAKLHMVSLEIYIY